MKACFRLGPVSLAISSAPLGSHLELPVLTASWAASLALHLQGASRNLEAASGSLSCHPAVSLCLARLSGKSTPMPGTTTLFWLVLDRVEVKPGSSV